MPLATVDFPTEESKEAAKRLLYVDELDRQARMGSDGINLAVARGLATEDSRDPDVWSALQSALFACIVVARTLQPAVKKKYQGLTSTQTKQYADERGEALRTLLEIEDSSPLFSVTEVRNAFEHYDERLDEHLVGGVTCISDWYISDGTALVTPPTANGQPQAVGLRVFYPDGGLLYFDNQALDLFALDIALLDLRNQIAAKRTELAAAISGRGAFGNHILVQLTTPEAAARRQREWRTVRAAALAGLAAAPGEEQSG
ncbi:hypothetical protein ACGFIY_23995 [Micromonospora chersina]|uniref:hypothetical protein n=1 Tax=Micromonospora chersina TaxID=47854 RepID=UPI0037228E56